MMKFKETYNLTEFEKDLKEWFKHYSTNPRFETTIIEKGYRFKLRSYPGGHQYNVYSPSGEEIYDSDYMDFDQYPKEYCFTTSMIDTIKIYINNY